jgi:hypothetical protein
MGVRDSRQALLGFLFLLGCYSFSFFIGLTRERFLKALVFPETLAKLRRFTRAEYDQCDKKK